MRNFRISKTTVYGYLGQGDGGSDVAAPPAASPQWPVEGRGTTGRWGGTTPITLGAHPAHAETVSIQ